MMARFIELKNLQLQLYHLLASVILCMYMNGHMRGALKAELLIESAWSGSSSGEMKKMYLSLRMQIICSSSLTK